LKRCISRRPSLLAHGRSSGLGWVKSFCHFGSLHFGFLAYFLAHNILFTLYPDGMGENHGIIYRRILEKTWHVLEGGFF
jgi:hypothetical protein